MLGALLICKIWGAFDVAKERMVSAVSSNALLSMTIHLATLSVCPHLVIVVNSPNDYIALLPYG